MPENRGVIILEYTATQRHQLWTTTFGVPPPFPPPQLDNSPTYSPFCWSDEQILFWNKIHSLH